MKKLFYSLILYLLANQLWANEIYVKYPNAAIMKMLNEALQNVEKGYNSNAQKRFRERYYFEKYNEKEFEIIDCENIVHKGIVIFFYTKQGTKATSGILAIFIELKNNKPIKYFMHDYSDIENLIKKMKRESYLFNPACL